MEKSMKYVIKSSKCASTAVVMLLLGFVGFALSDAWGQWEHNEEEASDPCPKPYVKTISPKTAAPLDEVKIRGNRFGHEPGSVTFFPGVDAGIISWSYKRIYVKVPEEAQSGDVLVTSSCGDTSNTVHVNVEKEIDPYY